MSELYGTVRSANINVDTDVEIFYFYRPTRGTDPDDMTGFVKGDPSWLIPAQYDNSIADIPNDILGLYELRLPLDIFNQKGFYTIYIRPRERKVKLSDVSVLVSYPDTKGVIFNLGDAELNGISDLTGYRIDYLDTNNSRTNISRIITSCNRCEPILVTIGDAYPKTTRYRLTDTGSNYVFCTVTPSSAVNFKPNVTPYIGIPGGTVFLTNRYIDIYDRG